MELYRKYRPKTFKQLIGNKDTIASIVKKIEDDTLPHALLLTGQSGTGKTTLGRIIANEINAKGFDYREIDSASFRGIDTIRDIRRKMQLAPIESNCIVYLMDEIALLGAGGASVKNLAQSALLKALEEPPDHCYFILCTTDPQMLMKTVRSRCVQYQMENITDKQMSILLKRITKKEKVTIKKDVINRIIEASEGRSREALTILEKIIHLSPKKMKAQIIKIQETESNGFKLAQLLFKGGSWSSVTKILKTLKNENHEQIRQVIFGFMITVTTNKPNQRAHDIMYHFQEPLYDNGYIRLWYKCHGIINDFEM